MSAIQNVNLKSHDILSDPVLIGHDTKGVCRLTLNHSHKRNALSEEMMAGLSSALSQANSDKTVRVIVLAAIGPVFCAGHDLKQLTAARGNGDKGVEYFSKIMKQCSALMQQIVRHPKPIIAEVAGVATAAGCQLVASCDLAIAAKSAQFATPGVNIGLFCSTPMVALSRNISRKHAMEMLLTGDMVKAKQAAKIGLINRAVKGGELTKETMQLAEKIASKSTMTVKIGKEAFYNQTEMGLAEAYQYAAHVMVENMMKKDAEEGINAFIAKRPAKWVDQ